VSDLVELIKDYQVKVKAEKIELLRLELPKKKMVEFLIEFQQPTKQRRISAQTVSRLITHFDRNWGEIERFFDLVEELKMPIDRWCALREEAKKMDTSVRETWQRAFDVCAESRSEIVIRIADLVPRVRASTIGYEGRNPEDLDGVGFMGLLKAMENYDATRGVPFEAYARSWIYNSIIQYLRKDKLVNPSEKVLRSLRLYDRTFTELQGKLGRDPDENEVAEAMHMSGEDLHQLLTIDTGTTSMDASFGEDEEGSLHDLLGAEEAEPYQQMEATVLARRLQQHMGTLANHELSIVMLRWFPIAPTPLEGEAMSIETAIDKMQLICMETLMRESPEGEAFIQSSGYQPTPTVEGTPPNRPFRRVPSSFI
jgi:RNA polymerase sigma factor (sigma-70 family)